ncbi:MAG: methyltransferase [Candidatus Daviesbacteria bacterium]|nr:methyltransferase [Candidatus Daviesbacteria bacterium]
MNKLNTINLKGFDIQFQTQPGVFSKAGLDDGTRLLIDNLEIEDGSLLADLGSGTGILGITCALLNPHGHVHLLDDHVRSAKLTKQNIEINKLRNAEGYLSDLFSEVDNRTYHQIFSNPPAQMGNDFLEEVTTQSFKHLKENGILWFVVPHHLKNVIEKLFQNVFGNCTIVAHGKEHIVLKAKK